MSPTPRILLSLSAGLSSIMNIQMWLQTRFFPGVQFLGVNKGWVWVFCTSPNVLCPHRQISEVCVHSSVKKSRCDKSNDWGRETRPVWLSFWIKKSFIFLLLSMLLHIHRACKGPEDSSWSPFVLGWGGGGQIVSSCIHWDVAYK